tara:strand:- start:157 stop:831 length:675 start_codon:yes stop_codon:yes gene_type:complete
MVYKLIIKISFFFTLCLLPMNSYSNIVYDKNNIIISNIDLNYYTQLYFENFGEKINKSNAIKNIVIIKNLINYFKKNNPDFLIRVDDVLIREYGKEKMDIQMVKDFVRYFKIKNEYIYEYYYSKFNIKDLENIFNSYEKIELPISNNDCMTILEINNLRGNKEFLYNFYENLKKEKKRYEVIIDNIRYDVCINSKKYKFFESSIFKYIDLKTKDEFKKFVYEQQ